MSLQTLQQESDKEYGEKFVIKSNAGTGLLRYTDADLIKSFLHLQLEKAYTLGLRKGVEKDTLSIMKIVMDCFYESQTLAFKTADISPNIDLDKMSKLLVKKLKEELK